MKDNSFISDLQFGNYFENKVIELLFEGKENIQIFQAPTCRFCDWDFKVENTSTGEITYYEVKADKAVLKTQNFFIETQSKNNSKSGLETTKANFYILVKPTPDLKEIDCLYQVETSYLHKLKDKPSTNYRRSYTGAYGFLVSEKELI